MKAEIQGSPSFAHIHIELESEESIFAEPDAMSSMSAEIEMKTKFNGGFFKGLLKRFLGDESLFINEFKNPTKTSQKITIVQSTPGDIRELVLDNSSFCLQPGAFIACTTGINIGVRYAGLSSFIAREGLFKLEVSGSGKVWYGSYGGVIEKQIEGEYIVDSSHLVGYEPQMQLSIKLAGGLISSFTSGEGLVTKVSGKGKIIIQTRSLDGLANWINPYLF
ncbi:MAG: TIGR00266 family protein [Leptospiraceae bacterium]|nr:TIGR00266 family protein [Leptospiraceae bacterium]